MMSVSGWTLLAAAAFITGVALAASVPVIIGVLLVRRYFRRWIKLLPLGYWQTSHVILWVIVVTLPIAVREDTAAELAYEELLNTVLVRVWSISVACLLPMLLIPWWHITAFADPDRFD
jgi:hypothetical protein